MKNIFFFGNCIDSCEYGYDNNNICKCPDKCKECNKESYNLNLCISCNNGFYIKFNEEKNKNMFLKMIKMLSKM